MHQETASNLETHIIKHHHHALADQRAEGELLACPCLMCPQSRKANMTLLELYNHLITVHGIPLQGKRKAQSQGQLHPLGHLKDVKKPNNAGKKWVLYRVDVEDKKNTGAKRVTAVGADSDEGSDVDFGSETLGIEAEEDECQVLSASDEELLAEPLLANDSAAYVVYGLAAMDTDAVSSADADADADTDVVSCAVLDADTALDADAVSGADAPAALDADMDADVVSGAALDAGARGVGCRHGRRRGVGRGVGRRRSVGRGHGVGRRRGVGRGRGRGRGRVWRGNGSRRASIWQSHDHGHVDGRRRGRARNHGRSLQFVADHGAGNTRWSSTTLPSDDGIRLRQPKYGCSPRSFSNGVWTIACKPYCKNW
ncbi:hypothetical protein B0H14DRAFT_1365493 [Mycena olivaceomarginata]|nr:hypothetical protein B0H14DRAFT_1365493 [Mycena olivaceomarginata]